MWMSPRIRLSTTEDCKRRRRTCPRMRAPCGALGLYRHVDLECLRFPGGKDTSPDRECQDPRDERCAQALFRVKMGRMRNNMGIPFATVMEIPWSTSSSPCFRGVTQRDVGNKMSAIFTSTVKTSGKSNVSIVYMVARCSRGKRR